MGDVQSHSIGGQLRTCAAAISTGTGEKGLWSSVDHLEVVDGEAIDSVVRALLLAGRRSDHRFRGGDPEPRLRRLAMLAQLAAGVEDELERVVDHLRRDGTATWAEIAESTGMKSKQAAAARFGKR